MTLGNLNDIPDGDVLIWSAGEVPAPVEDPEVVAADEQVVALESAAFDGKKVTAGELAEAREASRLARLVASGKEHRAEKKRRDEHHARQKQAKADALATFEPDLENLEVTRQAAIEALTAHRDALREHNSRVGTEIRAFEELGIPIRDDAHPDDDPEGFDRRFHAVRTSHGLTAIVLNGKRHSKIDVDRSLLQVIQRAHPDGYKTFGQPRGLPAF